MAEFIDDSEGLIGNSEIVFWQGTSNKKCETRTKLVVIPLSFVCSTVIGVLLFFMHIPEALIIPLCVLAQIVFLRKALRPRNGENYFVTGKKILLHTRPAHAYQPSSYWFTYDEVIGASVKQGLCGRLFDYAHIKVNVIHTWATSDTREVVKRKEGSVTFYYINDPEACMMMLQHAKETAQKAK